MSSNFYLLVHKDLPHAVSSSKSNTKQRARTTKPNKSPEHSAIQVSSALWLQLILVVCYLPHGIVAPLTTHSGQSSSDYLARQYTSTLVFLSSSINPILYCWKIREVRQAAKDILSNLFVHRVSLLQNVYARPSFFERRYILKVVYSKFNTSTILSGEINISLSLFIKYALELHFNTKTLRFRLPLCRAFL